MEIELYEVNMFNHHWLHSMTATVEQWKERLEEEYPNDVLEYTEEDGEIHCYADLEYVGLFDFTDTSAVKINV